MSESETLLKTPTWVFSCEFCEIFNNSSFIEHLRVTAFAKPAGYWETMK